MVVLLGANKTRNKMMVNMHFPLFSLTFILEVLDWEAFSGNSAIGKRSLPNKFVKVAITAYATYISYILDIFISHSDTLWPINSNYAGR